MLKILKKSILPLLVFTGVTSLFFYPVIARITRLIPAFYSTDEPYGVVWGFWWLKYSWLNGLSDKYTQLIAYPEGMKLFSPSFFPLWGLFAKWLGVLAGEIFAYNILMLSTFLIAGLSMFLLSLYLTRNSAVSIFCGLIYAFCPYHSVRAWQHFGTAQIQWMPLYLLFLFRLKNSRDYLSAALLALFLALNYYYDVHYAYFLFFATVLFFVLTLGSAQKKAEKIRFTWLLIASAVCAVLLILPAFLPFLKKAMEMARASANAYSLSKRPFEDLFSQSARPLSFFLPFTEQPLYGWITRFFVGSGLWGESLTEHNVFLGFIPLGLLFFALRKRKGVIAYYAHKGVDIGFAFNFFILLCCLCFFFSQPPWWNIFGFKLYMPSFFLYRIFPVVRAYGRFAILLMLGVAVLAAFGFEFFLEGLRTKKAKLTALIIMPLLVLFEFSYMPAQHTLDLGEYPKAYDWLRNSSPAAVIAEYPLDIEGPGEVYKFYQTKHNHPIINGAFPGTPAHNRLITLAKLSSTATADSLRRIGVGFVFVHLDEYEKSGLSQEIEEARNARANKGLKFMDSIGNIDIYEVRKERGDR